MTSLKKFNADAVIRAAIFPEPAQEHYYNTGRSGLQVNFSSLLASAPYEMGKERTNCVKIDLNGYADHHDCTQLADFFTKLAAALTQKGEAKILYK